MFALRRGVHVGAVVYQVLRHFDLVALGGEIQQRLEIVRAVIDTDPRLRKISADLAEVLALYQGHQVLSRCLCAGR